MTDTHHPWQAGPTEIISHALDHLNRASDFDRRIGYLLLDVGVETLLKTFLMLSETVTGTKMGYEKRREAAQGNFHQLVEGIRKAAGPRLKGIDLRHVEYHHGIRNKLYHEGDGVTATQVRAEEYAAIAVQLLNRLLGVVIHHPLRRGHRLVVDEFDGGKFGCAICGKDVEIPIGPVYVLAETLQPVCFPCGSRHDPSEELAHLLRNMWDLDDPTHYMDREHYRP